MKKTKEQDEILAEMLTDGAGPVEALRAAGYSEASARQGWKKVPVRIMSRLGKKGKRLIEKGKMDKQDLEHLVIGRLAENVISGKDGGAQSAKILGSHRDINAWTPEQMAGLIILQAPKELIERKDEILNAES